MGFREANLREHPAIKAWAKLQPESVPPTGIGRVREKLRGSVYRLEGVGPGGSDVIAKRSSLERIREERTLYEQVLPALPIPTVRYYGFVEEPDHACCWLFLEDAGGEGYSPLIAEHRALAARWLGLLHTAAAGAAAAARMPDRGPGHYLQCLRSAHRGIRAGLANPALSTDDLAVLQTLLSQCEIVASRWNQVERFCEGMPRTLVHGDFKGNNVCVRTSEAGLVLLPFDWGEASWGVPAIDLAQSPLSDPGFSGSADLATYGSAVRDHWPGLDRQTLQQWADVGTMFRAFAAVHWTSLRLAYEWIERPMARLRVYHAMIAHAMQAAGWVG